MGSSIYLNSRNRFVHTIALSLLVPALLCEDHPSTRLEFSDEDTSTAIVGVEVIFIPLGKSILPVRHAPALRNHRAADTPLVFLQASQATIVRRVVDVRLALHHA